MHDLIKIDFNGLRKVLYEVLVKMYTPDQLYVDIDSIKVSQDSVWDTEIDLNETFFIIRIRYGRYFDKDDAMNFQHTVNLSGYTSDSMDFIKGKFYQLVEQEDLNEHEGTE